MTVGLVASGRNRGRPATNSFIEEAARRSASLPMRASAVSSPSSCFATAYFSHVVRSGSELKARSKLNVLVKFAVRGRGVAEDERTPK